MPGAALIEYFVSARGTRIFLVTPDNTAPRVFEARLPDGESVMPAHLLARARRLLIDFHGLPDGWDGGPAADDYRGALRLEPAVPAQKRSLPVLQRNLAKPVFAYDLTYWQQLSEALLPRELRAAIEDRDLLCIVPHGPLHSLPFAALRWSETEFLIDRFGLCHAPSASVLRYCQRKNPRRSDAAGGVPKTCFVAAVAAADDADPAEFEADGSMLAAHFASGMFTLLSGAAPHNGTEPASKDRIRARIGGHAVVHMACHGVFGGDLSSGDPLDSGLLVSDGAAARGLAEFARLSPEERAACLLSAREILRLPLEADLVTLRACSSGRAEVESGDELIGLQRAFLYAGASSLVVSLWNVHKLSSHRLLTEFYNRWLDAGNPMPKWRALQEAQRSLIRDPEYGHPYHWAPFVLAGDWI
jgi:CHAT domain-containing protein